jgi:hypothetical protein
MPPGKDDFGLVKADFPGDGRASAKLILLIPDLSSAAANFVPATDVAVAHRAPHSGLARNSVVEGPGGLEPGPQSGAPASYPAHCSQGLRRDASVR